MFPVQTVGSALSTGQETLSVGIHLKRNHEGDYKCTDAEVRRMIADSDESHPRDSRILPNYSMEDIDKETLIQYRQLFPI